MRNIFLILCSWVVLLSCSSSRIVSAWGSDAYSSQHQKIVVFAVVNAADSALQKRMEQHVVADLQALGYNAHASLMTYGAQLKGLDALQVYQQLQADSVDAVMTIVLLDKQQEQVFIEEAPQQNTRPGNFWKYYEEVNKRAASAGYYTNLTTYFWEGKLYNLKAKELVYSSRTESFNPASAERLGHEYGKQIVNNMVKKGVLEKQAAPTRPI